MCFYGVYTLHSSTPYICSFNSKNVLIFKKIIFGIPKNISLKYYKLNTISDGPTLWTWSKFVPYLFFARKHWFRIGSASPISVTQYIIMTSCQFQSWDIGDELLNVSCKSKQFTNNIVRIHHCMYELCFFLK